MPLYIVLATLIMGAIGPACLLSTSCELDLISAG